MLHHVFRSCSLDIALHPVERIQDCSYFLFEGDKEQISQYCQISILNQSREQAFSVDKIAGPQLHWVWENFIFLALHSCVP